MKSSVLGLLSPENFLKKYWQKKPLLVRQAYSDFQSPIAADELAGLALEDDVEARLVIEHGGSPWELRRGPFTEQDFRSLPPSHWTLLVQAVNHWVPEVNELLSDFDFLPSWRLDDAMISYASEGGSVGPHYDQYDVFLIQAEGKRRWQIGPVYDERSSRLEDTELHILSDFEVVEDYVLEPGDMLYLPPGVGHHGVAIGNDCMTISVGFRAASHREILMQYTDFLSDKLPDRLRYSDADQVLPVNKCEIDDNALDRLQTILRAYTEDRQALSQWFGEWVTQLKHDQPIDTAFADWESLLVEGEGQSLTVNEGSRVAFRKTDTEFLLFADGESMACQSLETQQLAMSLCDEMSVKPEVWSVLSNTESQNLLLRLANNGTLYLC